MNERDEMIQNLLNRIEQLEERIEKFENEDSENYKGDAEPDLESQEKNSDMSGSQIVPEKPEDEIQEPGPSDGEVELGAVNSKEQEKLIRAAFEQTLIDRGGLLLPARTYDLELSLSYVHSSADNILIDGFTVLPVLVVGDIVSQRVRRDQLIGAVTGRLGLPWDFQFDVRVPYGYQTRRTFSADNEENTVSDSGLGDLEVGLSYQLYRSRGKWPDFLVSLSWKTDTGKSPFKADENEIFLGTGYHSLNLSLTTVKVVDPVVYFGGFNYSFNLPTNERIGRYDPGDSYGFNLGMAIALNLSSSLSFTYDQKLTGRSRLDGHSIPGSYLNTGVFSVGSSYSFADYLSFDFSIGVGLTRDSPDVLLGIAIPLRGKF